MSCQYRGPFVENLFCSFSKTELLPVPKIPRKKALRNFGLDEIPETFRLLETLMSRIMLSSNEVQLDYGVGDCRVALSVMGSELRTVSGATLLQWLRVSPGLETVKRISWSSISCT